MAHRNSWFTYQKWWIFPVRYVSTRGYQLLPLLNFRVGKAWQGCSASCVARAVAVLRPTAIRGGVQLGEFAGKIWEIPWGPHEKATMGNQGKPPGEDGVRWWFCHVFPCFMVVFIIVSYFFNLKTMENFGISWVSQGVLTMENRETDGDLPRLHKYGMNGPTATVHCILELCLDMMNLLWLCVCVYMYIYNIYVYIYIYTCIHVYMWLLKA